MDTATIMVLCDCCDNPVKETHVYIGYDGNFPNHVCLSCARKYAWNELHGPSGRVILRWDDWSRHWENA